MTRAPGLQKIGINGWEYSHSSQMKAFTSWWEQAALAGWQREGQLRSWGELKAGPIVIISLSKFTFFFLFFCPPRRLIRLTNMICLGFFSFYFLFSFFHLPANTAASSLPSQFISAVWQDWTVSGSGRESLMDARNNSRKNSQFSKKAGSLQALSQMSCSLCCLLEYQIIEIHFYSKIHIISG